MNFDDLKRSWNAHAQSLDTTLQLNRTTATAVLHARAATMLTRLRGWLWGEVAALAALLVWLGSFVVREWGHWPLAASALALHLGCVALMIAAIRQLHMLAGVDHSAPVVRLQRQLEQVAVVRIRTTCGAIVFGVLLWLPALAVALRDMLGADLYSVPDEGVRNWVLANLAFGVIVLLVARWAARRWGGRLDNQSLAGRALRSLGGQELEVARASLRELAEFADEDRAA